LSVDITHWDTSPLIKRVIEKPNLNLTLVFIDRLKDRIVQYILKLSLKPGHEATFSINSYVYKLGRHHWDIKKGLLKIYLKDFFAGIYRTILLDTIILPPNYKLGISKSLHVGSLQKK
jgi:RNA-directed DNA polymerase